MVMPAAGLTPAWSARSDYRVSVVGSVRTFSREQHVVATIIIGVGTIPALMAVAARARVNPWQAGSAAGA
jgi:hypothetical protein